MTIAITGLGLIGASLAKAYKAAGHTVFGYDIDTTVTDHAIMTGVIDAKLDEGNLPRCELVLVALYPGATVEYLERNAAIFADDSIVIDCCGIKGEVCGRGFALAREHGFTFVGGHPMAGLQLSGYKHSTADLFVGATMIIVPEHSDDMGFLERVKQLLTPAGFAKVTVSTAQRHDEIIAFTSQMAHIASNAYIKSPTATDHKGFSAGSYRDMTRVAQLNAEMWTQLFIPNREPLLRELDGYIAALAEYRDAIAAEDSDTLVKLLREGSERKVMVEGQG
ncbi:MAG: prephenate dehydrogenase [Oscillospiraceae bacterium]|nr:prephenate dehydrogenase [Oscillospiraceae bacterium]